MAIFSTNFSAIKLPCFMESTSNQVEQIDTMSFFRLFKALFFVLMFWQEVSTSTMCSLLSRLIFLRKQSFSSIELVELHEETLVVKPFCYQTKMKKDFWSIVHEKVLLLMSTKIKRLVCSCESLRLYRRKCLRTR